MAKAADKVKTAQRFLTLDAMRGYFIVIIIVNHLWRWPNAFIAISGANQLWFSGAEGFVILSGFLVGYVRGYKNSSLPFVAVTRKLVSRAATLYIWFIIMTLIYVITTWHLTLQGTPWIPIETGNYLQLLRETLSITFAHNWVHFLGLYTVLLLASPLIILLLRYKLLPVALGLIVLMQIAGQTTRIEWLVWGPVFFLPVVAGFYLPQLTKWWTGLRYRHAIRRALILATVVILGLSALCVFHIGDQPIIAELNSYFSKDNGISLGRLAVAAICFMGLYFIFDRMLPWIQKYLGWLLLSFGHWSLAIYTLHGFIIIAVAALLLPSSNIIINTTITLVAIVALRGLLAIKPLRDILPR